MLLAIDIGNTNISFGIFDGKRLIVRDAIPTPVKDFLPKLAQAFAQGAIEKVVICSVVPWATDKLERALKGLINFRQVYIIGKDLKVPLKNLYRKPGQVGIDRLVNAYCATVLYGAPLICVDFGTAITFDVISRKKEYLGGMILPGLKISLEALNQKTALLPKVKLEEPAEFIGRDSKNSILSGAIYGFAALTDSLAARIRKEIGGKALLIGTGGDIKLISKYCRAIDKVDRDLTLKGLNLLSSLI